MRKSRRTFWKVVPLFHGNGYHAPVLATPMCGIATLFSLLAIFGCINNGRARGCIVRAWIPFEKSLSLSQWLIYRAFQPLSPLLTFHKRFTLSVKAMWNVCAPSRPQETPANLYLQGLFASAVKVKAIFWKRNCLHQSVEHQALFAWDGASLHMILPWTHL